MLWTPLGTLEQEMPRNLPSLAGQLSKFQYLFIQVSPPQLATEYLENYVSCMVPETGAYLRHDAQSAEDPA